MKILAALKSTFRYRKTNVSIFLITGYISIICLYLYDQFSYKYMLPSTDDENAVILLETAWKDLQNITFSYHPYTSRDNDRVHDYLLQRVEEIVKDTSFSDLYDDSKLQTSNLFRQQDVFNVSSPRSRIIYFESSNIVVKLQGRNPTLPGLLISAHFDSVPTSHGATDDGKGIVSMLALLSHFSSNQPERTIIFNFNNNEEFGLLGATVFLKNPWSKLVKYVLNLEGTGTGGKSVLFRTSNTLTASLYKNSVKNQPFGNSIFQQGFNERVIKSETDYKVYEEYGLIGWDIAFYKPRSLYHTTRDSIAYTSREALWHMLHTSLQLSEYLCGSAASFEDNSMKSASSPAVYFDFAGLFFFVCAASSLFIWNSTILIIFPAALCILYIIASKRHTLKPSRLIHWCKLPISVFFSALLVKYTQQVILISNRYVMSREFLSPLITLSTEFILANFVFLSIFEAISKVDDFKDIVISELAVVSWISLAFANYHLKLSGYLATDTYPATIAYISLMSCLMVKYLVLAFKRKSSPKYTSRSDTSTCYNTSASANVSQDENYYEDLPDSQNAARNGSHEEDERAPLLHQTVLEPSSAAASITSASRYDVYSSTNYEWLLQFIILLPFSTLIFQTILETLSAINQSIQESTNSFDLVSNTLNWTSISLLSFIILPFILKLNRYSVTLLITIWTIGLGRSILLDSFTFQSPLKVRFVQNLNGQVELTGPIEYLEKLIFDLPSFKNNMSNKIHCEPTNDDVTMGVCSYTGETPNLIDYEDNTKDLEVMSISVLHNDRDNENRSKYAPINAELEIKVLDNRACTMFFNSSFKDKDFSLVKKVTIFHDNNQTNKSDETFKWAKGINELQLHKLDFTQNHYRVGIQWFPKILADIEETNEDLMNESDGNDPLGVNIICYWGEYDSEVLVNGRGVRKIPAYDELLAYSPLHFSFTNKEKGLVIAEEYIEI
ncbi:hypothetical protein KAFR_0C00370 [Kazachstania africana CBS 2517]|uniref:Peptide hydrolase n=1 Tax=Kazachstania africana (strain ATCC 22294 / BCRC 22015 / CBS 2517 / CECT 1963 / NBRC 1671 / NRRL Y-8276) TaxID=1071382 RepID=H2ARN3_KAZAF|nr:hypothetical protein KAFR_0C00370 [Kazachstania africana CBS 2517]CCF57033.1 hypothetical protein KAFR_0C00370 [Kazachstania africana CBS 2517]